jgi:branched-chain amino acid transport system substrate-binding protein
MDKTTKIIGWIIVAVVVIGAIYAYTKKDKGADQTGGDKVEVAGDTYKIGVILPLTGDAASYGEPARNVYEIATKEINDAGGVDGKKLELIIEDGKCSGKDATNAAQKLINTDKVQIILGGFCSSESLSAVTVAEAAKVALFSAASSSPDLTNKSAYFFRNYPSDASQGSVLAEVAFNAGWKKVGVLQEQQDYALGVFKAFETKFKSLGGEVVKEEFPKEATDFRTQLTKLKGENVNALFVDTQTPPASQRVFKQMQDMQWKPQVIINDVTTSDQETLTAFKDLLEGAIGAEFSSDASNPKLQAINKAYNSKHGIDLPYKVSYGATEYDAIYMIKDALMQVGYDGTKLAQWGHKVSNWPGASGSVTIGSDGDRVGGHTAKLVRNAKTENYKK